MQSRAHQRATPKAPPLPAAIRHSRAGHGGERPAFAIAPAAASKSRASMSRWGCDVVHAPASRLPIQALEMVHAGQHRVDGEVGVQASSRTEPRALTRAIVPPDRPRRRTPRRSSVLRRPPHGGRISNGACPNPAPKTPATASTSSELAQAAAPTGRPAPRPQVRGRREVGAAGMIRPDRRGGESHAALQPGPPAPPHQLDGGGVMSSACPCAQRPSRGAPARSQEMDAAALVVRAQASDELEAEAGRSGTVKNQ